LEVGNKVSMDEELFKCVGGF